MLAKIIFCTSVSLAILTVILLAVLSPIPDEKSARNTAWMALSLYVQQPRTPSPTAQQQQQGLGALIYHQTLTEGPESTSRVVGKAQGFIIPTEHFAHSAFNIIYLTFETSEYSGSLSVQADRLAHKEVEQLKVVGGTGSFAFARGIAMFTQTDQGGSANVDATYHIKLQLMFPNRSQTVPG
ncbi:hypothetical protein Ancab_006654 [Ancistrocladus abbreviatus]